MFRITALLLTCALSAALGAADKLAVDYKSYMKSLKGVQRSDDVFVTAAPALAVDGREIKGKSHTVAGQYFYVFGDKARALAGKNLVLRAKIKRISGIAPLSVGYRVFGNGNKFMSGRAVQTPAKLTGKWEDVELSFQIPPLSGIENVNVGFTLKQESKDNNRVIVDEVKLFYAEASGLVHSPGDSLGTAPLLLNKGPLVLIKDGVPQFKIVIPPGDKGIAAYAAKEIQHHIFLMTGKKPQIITDANYKGTALWIGGTSLAEKYGVTPAMIPPDNWVVARVGNAVIISGGDKPGATERNIVARGTIPLGTLSAAYEFLERVFNCRWYWPGKLGTVVPQHKDVSIGNFFKTGAPPYNCRALFYDISKDPDIPARDVVVWQRRNRLGGSAPDPIGMHSLNDFPAKFGKDHPEYFALQPDGRRKIGGDSGTHLCLTNPDVIREAGKWAVEYFRKNPGAKFVSIMPGDSNDLFYCRCPRCSALVTEKKGRAGIHSNAVWGFVNKVAAVVAKECPGKFVKCCAYADYLRRPDFALLPNVAVTLCYGALTRGGNDYKIPWREVIDEWRVTGAALYVWEYWNATRYHRGIYGAPSVFPRQLKEIYLLDRNQVSGRVIELADVAGTGVGVKSWADWMYDSLNLYIAMKLMWDADFDVEAELDRFYPDFYGPAAKTMREFYDEMEKAWVLGCYRLKGKNVWDWEVCWTKVYPPQFVDRMMGLLRRAVRETEGKEPFHARAKKTLEGYLPFENNSRMFRGVKSVKASKIEVPRGAAPVIDGKIGADEWKNAAVIDGFCDSYNVYKVKSKTAMKFRHDGKFLYVAVVAEIPKENAKIAKLPADLGRRDGYLWDYESVELFFAGKDDQRFQFILAPDNALFDAEWRDKRNLNTALKWQCEGIKFATTCSKEVWCGEVAIPLSVLKLTAPPAQGAYTTNFARNHRFVDARGTRHWEQSMWLPTFGSFHNKDRYGTLVLK